MKQILLQNKQIIPITSASLNITDSCNFNCQYCFVKQKPNHMPFQIANDAIQWLYKNKELYQSMFHKEKNIEVLFFGGEPMLEYNTIIKPLVLKYPEISYSITTNGSLLNKKKIDFFSSHYFSVLLSMDGNEITQNFNRQKDSFQQLNSIIPYLIQHIPNCGFRGTIIPSTCQYTCENIMYAHNMGFKQCYFTIDIFSTWNQQQISILEEEIRKFTNIYIHAFLNNINLINFTPFTNMIKLIIKHEVGILDNQINIYKCGLGNGYGAIDYKGDIFTCQEIVTDNEHNKLFHIGNIYTDINIESLLNLRQNIVNDLPITNTENNCENCPLIFCCKKNICQANNYICNQHCLIQSYNFCQWNQLLYKYAALSINYLQNLPNFQEYMKNIILEEEV